MELLSKLIPIDKLNAYTTIVKKLDLQVQIQLFSIIIAETPQADKEILLSEVLATLLPGEQVRNTHFYLFLQ